MDILVRHFLDSLTDTQFLAFTLFYGLNEKSVHLTVREISDALETSPSTVYGALGIVANRLKLTIYRPILDALQTNETHTDF